MREILFRGKDIAGNWHYGVPLIFIDDYVCITKPHTYNKSVIPETVGQYTGLTDKNGKKIFEGDIVAHFVNYLGKRINAVVEYDSKYAMYVCNEIKYASKPALVDWTENNGIEIVGNIHDNPELLKGGVEE